MPLNCNPFPEALFDWKRKGRWYSGPLHEGGRLKITRKISRSIGNLIQTVFIYLFIYLFIFVYMFWDVHVCLSKTRFSLVYTVSGKVDQRE